MGLDKKSDKTEKIVLGTLMLFRHEQDKIDIIETDFFYDPKHKEVIRAMKAMRDEQIEIDLLTLSKRVNPALVSAYDLTTYTDSIGSSANFDRHVFELRNAWMIRELVAKCDRMKILSQQHNAQAIDLINELETATNQITSSQSERFEMLPDVVSTAIDQIQTIAQNRAKAEELGEKFISGVPTGITKFDLNTGGFQPSDLIILAARPAMGKTAFMLSAAKYASELSPVALFSLEMSANQLAMRLISMETGITVKNMTSGKIEKNEWPRLNNAEAVLRNHHIIVDDSAGITLGQIRYRAKMMQRQHGIKAVFVDYLQLVSNAKRGANREQEIASIARGFKVMAKELNIPVIALSQLSRAVETRGGEKKPMLSDLRESGAIEQDADMVLFLHRSSYYGVTHDENGDSTDGVGEIIIAKYRNGPTNTLKAAFDSMRIKWGDLEEWTFKENIDYSDAPF